jgi:radical SAM protein with 4Fe4S-binding SPASM domain
MGEPLLNKNICEFVALLKNKGHTVFFVTNGTLMNQYLAKGLLIAGIDQVTFSIDGYNASTYENIRIGANYDKVRQNVEAFCFLKRSLNKPTTVQINCISSDITRSEIPAMQDYWSGKVDCFNPIPLDDWAGKLELPGKFGLRNWVPRRLGHSRYPCDLLWTTMAISAEGYVMYCCHDYKLLSDLPNVNEQPLGMIWKTKVSEERRNHVENRIDREPCMDCDAWKTRSPYLYQIPSSFKNVISLIPVKHKAAIKRVFMSLIR